MKKNLFVVAAAALMALVSCNKEELGNNTNGVVFTAEFEQDATTKTTLGEMGEKGRKAHWVKGDKVKINGVEFSATSDGPVAEFVTEADFAEAATYRAVYPAESYKGSGVLIPAAQNGAFANASISVAESNVQTLVFNNLSSILKFQVPVSCTTVTFESINSIAGQISVSYADGVMTPNYTSLTNQQKKIIVTVEGGFVAGTDYYVAVKPGSHKFTVKIDGNLSKASEKAVTVERTKIHNLGVLPKAKLARDLAYDKTTVNHTLGNTFTAPKLTGITDGVTYKSSNTAVATIDAAGNVTVVGAEGTTIITASAPATENYLADEATYTLTVEKALTDWNLRGSFGTINMSKSDVYTDLYVAKNVALGNEKTFKFINKDKTQTVGAYGNSTANVDVKGQINTWYNSDSTNSYAANIYVSTSGQYDVYYSPSDKNFLIIKTGVEEVNTDWAVVGYIGGKDLWNSTQYRIKNNYVLAVYSITMELTSNDYFKFLKGNSWTAGNVNSGWIAGAGSDDQGVTDITVAAGNTSTYNSHRSWGDYKSQFHMKHNGTYKITLIVDENNAYGDATVKFNRIK